MVIKYLGDDEAYKVAMNLEGGGIDFYSNMANCAKDAAVKKIFAALLEDEKRHYATFSKLDEALKDGPAARPYEIDEEIALYIKSLVEPGIFKKLPDGEGICKLSQQEALGAGIQAEKDSILFYTEAAKSCQSPSGKEAFARIVEEEKGHLVTLARRLRQIRGKIE